MATPEYPMVNPVSRAHADGAHDLGMTPEPYSSARAVRRGLLFGRRGMVSGPNS